MAIRILDPMVPRIMQAALAPDWGYVSVGVGEQSLQSLSIAHLRCPRRDPAEIAIVGYDALAHDFRPGGHVDRERAIFACLHEITNLARIVLVYEITIPHVH